MDDLAPPEAAADRVGGPTVVLDATAPVAGGAALARDANGRVVFVAGALPGERIEAEIIAEKRDFARARTVAVLDASPDRVTPPCPHVERGCGGCDLQHVRADAQPALKRAIVRDALRRIGRIDEPPVETASALPTSGFRTTVRCAVVGARAGFRMARSHDVVDVDHCLVAHPLIDELIAGGSFPDRSEVTFRVGSATGERLVIASPAAAGVALPTTASDTVVVGDDELAAGRHAWIHDVVDGERFRISARSFFQTRTDGAVALAAAVREAGGAELRDAAAVVDAYCGVGLLGIVAAPITATVVAVESGRSSVADARHNFATAGRQAEVIRSTLERWRPTAADVVIADPARSGLGREAAAVVVATHAPVIVLVSCDPASLARDATLLAPHGYRLERSVIVDLFPHTHHIEVVSRFAR